MVIDCLALNPISRREKQRFFIVMEGVSLLVFVQEQITSLSFVPKQKKYEDSDRRKSERTACNLSIRSLQRRMTNKFVQWSRWERIFLTHSFFRSRPPFLFNLFDDFDIAKRCGCFDFCMMIRSRTKFPKFYRTSTPESRRN